MAKSNKEFETIKIDKAVVDKVRVNKEKTGVPIAVFVETAVEEKLKGQKK